MGAPEDRIAVEHVDARTDLDRERPAIPLAVTIRTATTTFRILRRRLGLGPTVRVLARLGLGLRNRPFGHLPPPSDERESLSRKQAGPAILLYQILRERRTADEALAIVREVVVAGALIFLDRCLGALTPRLVDDLSGDERERIVRRLASRFFNATVRLDEVGGDRVRLTVTACRFASLARDAGVPEIAPLFCAGDESYFGGVLPQVQLSRPHTIAAGAETCAFELSRRR